MLASVPRVVNLLAFFNSQKHMCERFNLKFFVMKMSNGFLLTSLTLPRAEKHLLRVVTVGNGQIFVNEM